MGNPTITIDAIGEDLLQNVLGRLPALSFASAACVSRSWNLLCDSLLSNPKLSSALSLNPSLQDAVEEVFHKVFSEPIRPHFAMVSVGPSFSQHEVRQLVSKRLGSTVPVVYTAPFGLIGRNAITNEFRELQWEVTEDDDHDVNFFYEDPSARFSDQNRAILLTVGFLPGIKVAAIPLFQSKKEVLFVDEFVSDIRECAASVSGCTSPVGIILFADIKTDTDQLLIKLDHCMSPETVIVGDGKGVFLYGGDSMENARRKDQHPVIAAVALLFMRDRGKPHGTGNIQFHMALSSGVSPIGPIFKAVKVKEKHHEGSTWLTAKREGVLENLDGQTILNHIYDEMSDRIQYPAFYIGVMKRRKCSDGLHKVSWITSQVFHDVNRGDEEYLYVGGGDIKTGDLFRFFHSDSHMALSSLNDVSDKLRRLKQDFDVETSHRMRSATGNSDKKIVFGGIIFSCCGRGEPFFGKNNVDSSPFLENFPGVTLAGSFCGGEIGRGDSSPYNRQESQQHDSYRCCVHSYSSVYLVMSYTPPPLEF